MDTIKAADKLHERGYKNINILQEGLEAWRIWDLPLAGYGVDQSDDPKTLLKLEDRSFQVDTTQSRIEWIGRNTNSSHFGAVRIAAGEIIVKDGSIIGNFDIDRTKWNIVYGSTRFFEHLGKHLVFDLIGIQVRIIAF